MPIVQISRIQHRRGKATDLPQLAAGELGWSIDDRKLYIGNGTLADGAPNIGNTEIVTAGSSSFTTALTHVYKGYLGDATTINTGNTTRTLQSVLDDYVIGQAHAKKVLSVAVHNHYKRLNYESKTSKNVELAK